MSEAQHTPAVLMGGPESAAAQFVIRPNRNRNARPRKRNAGTKRAKPRHRNAAGPAPARAKESKPAPPARLTLKEFGVKALASTLGSMGSSWVGGSAVRIGVPPVVAALLIGASGAALTGLATGASTQDLGTGILSAAASQGLLMLMGAAPKPTTVIVAQSAPQPKPKNSDLGVLPSGALDSAFERARAELAVRGDQSPEGTHPDHHTIPFVPM